MNSGWRERRLFSLKGNTSFFSAPTPTRARSVTILRGVLLTAISPAGISISMLTGARLVTLLQGILPRAMSTAGVSIPMLTRAPTALRLANSHQPASRSQRSPELLLRGVLPTAISPARVSIPTLTRAPTTRHLANSHPASCCLDSGAHQS